MIGLHNLPLADVRPGPQYHVPRLSTDPYAVRWVEYYREQIRAGRELEPIRIDARFFIIDGHHRWRAHVLEKQEKIRVVVCPLAMLY